MALNATIFKIDLQIADLDRHYYHDHALTVARHPSETDERMMLRVLAFARHASEQLAFGKGLSTESEPALWARSLAGEVELWIEVGTPDEKHLRRASGQSRRVIVYAYGGQAVAHWWQQQHKQLLKLDKLAVYQVSDETCRALTQLVKRGMRIQCTIQDGEILLTDGETTVQVELTTLKPGQETQT